MALKTIQNDGDVRVFLNAIEDEQKREDCFQLLEWMEAITGAKATMWGDSIVGFGSYHYVYASGREGDWMLTGFSPRKQNISIYAMCDLAHFTDTLADLGKHKTGKSCLYIKRLSDIDSLVLQDLIQQSVQYTKDKYPD